MLDPEAAWWAEEAGRCLRDLHELVPRLWLNLNEEIGLILGRARLHCFPTGGRRKNPGQSSSPSSASGALCKGAR